MKKMYSIFLLIFLTTISGWAQGQLQPFNEDVESQADFTQDNLIGWTSLDLDGLNTAGPFQEFPGKGGPLGFIVYNPSQTTPVNVLDAYIPHSGEKYFASISSYDGPVNDWLISDELADHPGGVLSFYVKSSFDYAGDDSFKVGYSTTGEDPADFTLFNGGTPTAPSTTWTKFEYVIPAGAKHLAINCVSEAVMMLVDDIKFVPNVEALAPNAITDFSVSTELGGQITNTFNWINPTIDHDGNALASMTGVKVYRGTSPMNLAEIADLASATGESMTYEDILPESGFFTYRFVPYNNSGNGNAYNTPVNFFGYETTPGAPTNITFTQNASLQNVISWDAVDYGALGGTLQDPVVGYTIKRTLGSDTETLAEMHAGTTYTETDIPPLNLYTYTIIAQTSPTNLGVPAVVSDYSGLDANQVSVTSGNKASDQPFELNAASIISQSIYTPEEIGDTGLITSISYFGNLGRAITTHYKIYMSVTDRDTFGTNLDDAVWEYYGDQKLLFDGDIDFPAGLGSTTIALDQPFYYDASTNKNVVITIIKPLVENPPSINPSEFFNTPVDGMRTYYANGYSVDLSIATTQPPSWSTDEVATIPSVVLEKSTDYGSLAGVVTVLADGSPLEGATVKITPEGSGTYQTETTTTDADGAYSIAALIPGNYVATFSKDAFNTYEESIEITANEQLTLDAVLENAVAILISGNVVDAAGAGIEGVTLNLTGFSEFTTVTDASGDFTLEAFADKEYDLEVVHPLYVPQSLSFTSEADDYSLDPITLAIAVHKPGNVMAVNNNDVGDVNWRVPVGTYNETTLGWGSFTTAGDSYGNGGDPFIAGIRFETSDLEAQVTTGAELTQVKVYMANSAEIIIKVFEGEDGAELVYSQPESITEEGWYVFDLNTAIPIDTSKELWIGVEFQAGQYGAYPMGLDDGPNAPDKKGSMMYTNGVWNRMSLTNKNWNIYGIANNTVDADPSGYKVYRSPAAEENWTELTPAPITETSFSDTSLSSAAPDVYKYGVTALYGNDLISEKGISNEIEYNLFFDYTLDVAADSGSSEGAYVSIWNDDNFAEAFVPAAASVTFPHLLRGNYSVRIEKDNYEIVELTDVTVEDNNSLTVPLNLLKVQPSELTATIESATSARLDWSLNSTYTDEIEKYQDFERDNIGDYILKDLDGLNTYTYNNFSWPNNGIPMSFMVFNPYETTPPINEEIAPFSGRRFLTAFASPDGAENDWIIVPAGSGAFSFMAASLVGTAPEKIKVLYSTTGTEVSDFTAFGDVIDVPEAWTEYAYEAPEDTKYVAINYVGNDTYILKVDDLTYQKKYDHALSYNIYLDGDLVAENVTDRNYTFEGLSQEGHIAEVEAVYETGVSEKTEVEFFMLGVNDLNKSEFVVYPNPSSGTFSLKLSSRATISIFDINGRKLYTGVKEAGTSMMHQDFAPGTYILQVQTAEGTATKKLIFY